MTPIQTRETSQRCSIRFPARSSELSAAGKKLRQVWGRGSRICDFVTTVLVTPTAVEDLDRLISMHSLPTDTLARFRRSVGSLEQFPLIGAPLQGRWADFRFVLGPWRWMLVVYLYDPTLDRVGIVTIQDARSESAATGR